MSRKPEYVYLIDLVRFSSALIVVVFHLMFSIWAGGNGTGSKIVTVEDYSFVELIPLTWFGWVGVEIFFVISGYVIANSSNGKSALYFIKSRVLRLYPAVWVCASITMVLLMVTGIYSSESTMQRYVHSLFLLPIHPWVDPVYWTLAVELSFYFVYFCLIFFQKMKFVFHMALILTVLTALYQLPVLACNILLVKQCAIFPLQISRLLMLDFGAFFSLGILIWLYHSGHKGYKFKLALLFSIVVCMVELINHTFKVYSALPILIRSENVFFILPTVVWSISIIAIFFGYRFNKSIERFGIKVVKMIRVMGLMTFPVYLLHFTLGGFVIDRLLFYYSVNKYAALTLALVIILATGYVVSVYIEPRLRTLLGSKIDRIILCIENFASLGRLKRKNKDY